MAVLIDKNTRLLVQGLTGREGTFHTKQAAASFTMPWSRNLFLSEFRNQKVSLLLVARSRECVSKVIGYIVCWAVTDELHILDLATECSWRRRGVARKLVLAAIRTGRERGAKRVFLEVRASNTAALVLYDGLGFSRSLVRTGYYDMPVEDAEVMTLEGDALESLLKKHRDAQVV